MCWTWQHLTENNFWNVFLPSLGCILTPSHGQADAVVIGYSCKSLSKQNNYAQSFTDRTSKSGSGYCGLMDYVDYAQPSLVVAENVSSSLDL